MLERFVQWETLAPRTAENVPPEDAILWREVSRSDPLQRFLWSAGAAGATVLVIVNDPHRATRTRPVLAALCEARRGLTRQPRFRALVATGTHRFDAPERRAFETATFHDCGLELDAVAWHDAFDSSALAEIAGFRMHRWIEESEFLLPIGSVGLHYFAGLTGAHKTATIGCMSYEDIERNHAGAMDSASDAFVCRGNPVFDDIARTLGALELAGKRICAVNQIVRDNSAVDARAGSWLDSLVGLTAAVFRTSFQYVPHAVDILHLKVPPPLGRSFYQADKALKNNHLAVRDSGGIILEADCSDGIGPDAFMSLLREAPDYASAVRIVQQRGYRLGDHKAVKLRHLTDPAVRNVRVALVSTHIAQTHADTVGLTVFETVEAATSWLTGGVIDGSLLRGLRIDDAGNFRATPCGQEPIEFPDTP